jgi:hypothetical protein
MDKEFLIPAIPTATKDNLLLFPVAVFGKPG